MLIYIFDDLSVSKSADFHFRLICSLNVCEWCKNVNTLLQGCPNVMEGHYPEKFSSIPYQTPQLANQGLQTP